MTRGHIQKANGPDAPPGIRLSWQAVAAIIAVLGLLLTLGSWVSELVRDPMRAAIAAGEQIDLRQWERIRDVQEKQETVNRKILGDLGEIKGTLKELTK